MSFSVMRSETASANHSWMPSGCAVQGKTRFRSSSVLGKNTASVIASIFCTRIFTRFFSRARIYFPWKNHSKSRIFFSGPQVKEEAVCPPTLWRVLFPAAAIKRDAGFRGLRPKGLFCQSGRQSAALFVVSTMQHAKRRLIAKQWEAWLW